ncbi:MAG: hypothetical protein E7G24_10100 [Clostridium celatum]|nr:hypothetical protein [Clostridium celatum]
MNITKEMIIGGLVVLGGLTFTLRLIFKKSHKDSNNKNTVNQTAIGNGTYNQAGRDINAK